MLKHKVSVVTKLENWNGFQDYPVCLIVVSNYTGKKQNQKNPPNLYIEDKVGILYTYKNNIV